MSLRLDEVTAVVNALGEVCIGLRVQKIWSPVARDRVVFSLYGEGRTVLVQVTVTPGANRIGCLQKKPAVNQRPTPFVMLCRKHLIGARLAAVRQPGRDRAVAFEFESINGLLTVMTELTDRHANVFLLGGEKIILGTLRPVRSVSRPLATGGVYHEMNPVAHTPVRENRFAAFWGAKLLKQVERTIGNAETMRNAVRRKQVAISAITRQIGKVERTIYRINQDLARIEQAPRIRLWAKILQSNLWQVKPGAVELETVDFEGQPVVVKLDTTKSAVANMEAMFDKARRLSLAEPGVRSRLEQQRKQLMALKVQRDELNAQPVSAFEAPPDNAGKTRPGRAVSKKKVDAVRKPYREIPISGGKVARVGKGARENDELTLKHAALSDLWLHARGVPGSHVVVPMSRTEQVSEPILLDAAHLAAHFSKARREQVVEVTYTTCRYVSKRKGSPAGMMHLIKEKSIILRVEEARLAALLKGKVEKGVAGR